MSLKVSHPWFFLSPRHFFFLRLGLGVVANLARVYENYVNLYSAWLRILLFPSFSGRFDGCFPLGRLFGLT